MDLLEQIWRDLKKKDKALTALQIDIVPTGIEIKIDKPVFEELGKTDQTRFMSAIDDIVKLLHKAVTGETIKDADLKEGSIEDRKCEECEARGLCEMVNNKCKPN